LCWSRGQCRSWSSFGAVGGAVPVGAEGAAGYVAVGWLSVLEQRALEQSVSALHLSVWSIWSSCYPSCRGRWNTPRRCPICRCWSTLLCLIGWCWKSRCWNTRRCELGTTFGREVNILLGAELGCNAGTKLGYNVSAALGCEVM
jgi:hypothetical protein